MKEQKKYKLVNILMPIEMVADLQTMAIQSDTDRSKLIRNLIRKEWNKLQQEAQAQKIVEA